MSTLCPLLLVFLSRPKRERGTEHRMGRTIEESREAERGHRVQIPAVSRDWRPADLIALTEELQGKSPMPFLYHIHRAQCVVSQGGPCHSLPLDRNCWGMKEAAPRARESEQYHAPKPVILRNLKPSLSLLRTHCIEYSSWAVTSYQWPRGTVQPCTYCSSVLHCTYIVHSTISAPDTAGPRLARREKVRKCE